MGYHLTLVNTAENGGSTLSNRTHMREILSRTGLVEEELGSSGDYAYFHPQEPEGFTLFYSTHAQTYYINTTDDEHIIRLTKIAALLNDGTYVQGDEGESYTTEGKAYIHPDHAAEIARQQAQCSKQHKRLWIWRIGIVLANILLLLLTWYSRQK